MTDTSTEAVGQLISNLRQWSDKTTDEWILYAADQLEHLRRERDALKVTNKMLNDLLQSTLARSVLAPDQRSASGMKMVVRPARNSGEFE